MKNLTKITMAAISALMLTACRNDDKAEEKGTLNLQFNNVVGNQALKIGDAVTTATAYTSNGQIIKFGEVKYVISNIVLVKADGSEVPYNTEDLDKGAFIIDQSNTPSLSPVLSNLPKGEYKQIKFGLGIKKELNDLRLQEKFPKFYTAAGAFDDNKGSMHWEWSGGFRFAKIEGWFSDENKTLSIHTGSAFKYADKTAEDAKDKTKTILNDSRDAFRYITLDLPTKAVVGGAKSPKIVINADWDKLVNGTNKITFVDANNGTNNTKAIVHHLNHMFFYVNNLGGNQDINGQQIIVKDINDATKAQAGIDNTTLDTKGMFSVSKVEN